MLSRPNVSPPGCDAGNRPVLTDANRILVEVHHPGHVHIFEGLIRRAGRERTVVVLAKDRPGVWALLTEKGIPFVGYRDLRRGKSVFFTGVDLIYSWLAVLNAIRTTRSSALVGIAAAYLALPGLLFRLPVYAFTDTETATLSHALAFPIATRIFVPACYDESADRAWKLGGRRIRRYAGTQECAYLLEAPPDPEGFRRRHGLNAGLFTIRISAGEAFHESMDRRIETVKSIAEELSKRGRVVINAEKNCPPELEAFASPFRADEYHSLLAASELVITEGATTATEAALLGTPYIFVNRNRYGTIRRALEAGMGIAVNSFEECHALVSSGRIPDKSRLGEKSALFRRDLENPLDLLLPPG